MFVKSKKRKKNFLPFAVNPPKGEDLRENIKILFINWSGERSKRKRLIKINVSFLPIFHSPIF